MAKISSASVLLGLILVFVVFSVSMSYAVSNNSTASLLYVCDAGSGNISVIDLSTNNVTASIDRASVPFDSAISPDGSRLYVVNEFSGTLSAIDTVTGELTGTGRIGFGPHYMALNAAGSEAYVLCGYDVVVLNTSTLNITDKISIDGMAPIGIDTSSDGRRIYVPDMGLYSVLIVDASTHNVTKAYIDGLPIAVSASHDNKLIYAASISKTSWDKLQSNEPQDKGLATLIASLIQWITGSGKEYNDIYVMDAVNGSVLSTVEVEGVPTGITSSPDGMHVYVACIEGRNTYISVIDMQSRAVTDRISIPIDMRYTGYPASLAVSSDGEFLYAAHGNENAVARVDLNDRSVKKIDTDKALNGISTAPASISISPDGSTIYTINSRSNTVSEIDTASGSVKDTLKLWWYPVHIALTADGSRAYVTNEYGNSVTVIDTLNNHILSDISVGDSPKGVAVDPDGRYVYVTNYQDKTASIIDVNTNAVIRTIDAGNFPSGVVFSPDGQNAYIVANQARPLMAINTMSPGSSPYLFDVADSRFNSTSGSMYFSGGIAVSPDGLRIFVTCHNASDNGSVLVFDTQKKALVAAIGVGKVPEGIAISPDGSRLYVANSRDNSISVIDAKAGKVLATVKLDGYMANGIAINEDGSRVYVTHDTLEGDVSVIDTASNAVIASIHVGNGPAGLAIKPGY